MTDNPHGFFSFLPLSLGSLESFGGASFPAGFDLFEELEHGFLHVLVAQVLEPDHNHFASRM
jgi:hypothetical protein